MVQSFLRVAPSFLNLGRYGLNDGGLVPPPGGRLPNGGRGGRPMGGLHMGGRAGGGGGIGLIIGGR